MQTQLRALEEPITLSVDQAVVVSGLSRAHLYKAMASGELLFLKIGPTRRIERDALKDYVHTVALRCTPRRSR
jgi:excisionase family DNA binding protein